MNSPGPNSCRRKSIAILSPGAVPPRAVVRAQDQNRALFSGTSAPADREVLRRGYRKNRKKTERCSKTKHSTVLYSCAWNVASLALPLTYLAPACRQQASRRLLCRCSGATQRASAGRATPVLNWIWNAPENYRFRSRRGLTVCRNRELRVIPNGVPRSIIPAAVWRAREAEGSCFLRNNLACRGPELR
jgi:hypothetical protein